MESRTLVVLVSALLVTAGAGVPMAVAQSASGSSDDPAWADDLFADLQEMQSRYNANVSDAEMNFAQRQVYNQLKGNVVNVYFHGTDVVFSFYMRPDGTITDLRQSPREDAGLRMQLTRETAEDLAARPNPVPPFVDAVQDGSFVRRGGERTIRGVVIDGERGHPVKQVTWTVINGVKGLF